jgi:hypothetical protein
MRKIPAIVFPLALVLFGIGFCEIPRTWPAVAFWAIFFSALIIVARAERKPAKPAVKSGYGEVPPSPMAPRCAPTPRAPECSRDLDRTLQRRTRFRPSR